MSENTTERDERLRAIRERVDAATEGPWFGSAGGTVVYGRTPGDEVGAFRLVADAALTQHAREDLPYLLDEVTRLSALLDERDAAIRGVIDWDLVEDDSWLGSMRTQNVEGEDPGNEAYMGYIDRVLTAAGHTAKDGFRWGPILLAIILDRHVRETEKFVALDATVALPASHAEAEAWDEGFESCFTWEQQTNGIPHDPPLNPYRAALDGGAS